MTKETFIRIRNYLRLNQADFSKVINRSRSYVSKVEQGMIQITPSAECEILTRVEQYKSGTCVKFQQITDEKINTPSLSIIPPVTLAEHFELVNETVKENNDLLEKIREDQERELELKRAQGRQIKEALELIQGMDGLVQARVRDIIDERTRTIVTISKHQMHSQALITIAAIEGIINMVEEGITKPSLFLRQLRTVRDQLKEMNQDSKR